jgi:hypothetical protein
MVTFTQVAEQWAREVEAEKAWRREWLKAFRKTYPAARISRKQRQWATMTGAYWADADRMWHVESDGTRWSERFI